MGHHSLLIFSVCAFMFMSCRGNSWPSPAPPDQKRTAKPVVDRDASTPDPEVLRIADSVAGKFTVPDKRHVVVIDYDRSLYAVRLFVVEMRKKQIVLRSPVSHALKSGKIFATEFSNLNDTKKSCIGAFRTGEVYNGKFGYSLRIDGLQRGVNDNARARSIVFHDFDTIPAYSDGCFMTKPDVNRQLINLIKGGCLVYVRKTAAAGASMPSGSRDR